MEVLSGGTELSHKGRVECTVTTEFYRFMGSFLTALFVQLAYGRFARIVRATWSVLMRNLFALFVAWCVLQGGGWELRAQDGVEPSSRTEQIEDEQSQRAQVLTPDVPAPPERQFAKVENTLRDIFQGVPLHVQLGGLPFASGLALGPAFLWSNRTDRLRVKSWAVGSVLGYYSVGVGMELPRVTNERFALTSEAFHLDSPRLDYYGQGNSSLKSNRTDYRREDTYLTFGVNWPLTAKIKPICAVAQDFLDIGPGTNDRVTPTDVKFGPVEAPGIDTETSYVSGGCTVPFDFRDNPAFPHQGTAVFVGVTRFNAEANDRYSFNRVSASAEHYIPFFNQKRVIALHTATELSYHGQDQVVPFYMQPTLGGPLDLRGFRARRFYDENSFYMNGEYRWEIFTGFEMAVFADAGRVFHRPWQISLSNLQSSGGLGSGLTTSRAPSCA